MPPAPAYAAHQPYPALYLYPLNDSFVPKHISLVGGQRVKIGRQTNPKTAPGEKNGFFDSKVLSRQHAEIWEDTTKIYIKDVKSSNGTFINGERLSPEGVESDPYELKSDDIVEFGIDIVGEDNKTIIHHKVAARAVCVFSEQDAQVAARAEQHQQQQQQQQHLLQQQHQQQYAQHSMMGGSGGGGAGPGQPGGPPNGVSSQFNFGGSGGGGGGGPQQRRPGPGNGPGGPGQGLAGIGGMGGSMRPPGKSGLTFEHILNRLQGELQKSRETGSELHSLSGSMNDVHQVLGGNIPSNIPPYPPHSLPPVRPPVRQPSPSQQEPHPTAAAPSPPPPPPPTAPSDHPHPQEQPSSSPPPEPQQQQSSISSSSAPAPPIIVISQLQSQLHDTQTSLAEHANKVRALEDLLTDHELIRKELRDLRQLFEGRSSRHHHPVREDDNEIDMDQHHQHQRHHHGDEDGLLEPRGGFDEEDDEEDDEDIQHIRMLDDDMEDGIDNDDARSISTIIPHELEPVDEEDEEEDLEQEEREGPIDEIEFGEQNSGVSGEGHGGEGDDGDDDDTRADPIDPEREREDESSSSGRQQREHQFEQEAAAALRRRKREDLDVGRPRTPEPSSFVGEGATKQPNASLAINTSNITSTGSSSSPRTRSGTLLGPNSRSPSSSPLARPHQQQQQQEEEEMVVMEHVLQLNAQISAMAKLTSNMEAQYSVAQDTIRALESKVLDLEKMVKEEKEVRSLAAAPVVVATASVPSASTDNRDGEEDRKSLTEFFSEWKKTVDGQWSDVKEEWREERERLKRAREEWEVKMKSVDTGLEKINQIHISTTALVKDVGVQKQDLARMQSQFQHATLGGLRMNGDVKYGGGSGLVTPPSPTSQSSSSGSPSSSPGGSRSRRRKNKSRGRSGRRSSGGSGDESGGSDDEAVKVTAFANGDASGLSPSPNHPEPALTPSPSSSSNNTATTSGSPPKGTSTAAADGTTVSRAYYISLPDVQKEHIFDDYEDDAGSSSLASEEDDADEGKKVPGPKDPAVKAKARAAAAAAKGHPSSPALLASSAASATGLDGGESSAEQMEVEQKKLLSHRQNAVNFQTAGAVVVLAVAAAAVFWKVRSE